MKKSGLTLYMVACVPWPRLTTSWTVFHMVLQCHNRVTQYLACPQRMNSMPNHPGGNVPGNGSFHVVTPAASKKPVESKAEADLGRRFQSGSPWMSYSLVKQPEQCHNSTPQDGKSLQNNHAWSLDSKKDKHRTATMHRWCAAIASTGPRNRHNRCGSNYTVLTNCTVFAESNSNEVYFRSLWLN